jgi:hypothetical protein
VRKPTDATLEVLIDAAEASAFVEVLRESPRITDTPENRVHLAQLARDAVFHQVALGWWQRFGIKEREDIAGLVVTCEDAEGLPRLKFDFSRTNMSRVTG